MRYKTYYFTFNMSQKARMSMEDMKAAEDLALEMEWDFLAGVEFLAEQTGLNFNECYYWLCRATKGENITI